MMKKTKKELELSFKRLRAEGRKIKDKYPILFEKEWSFQKAGGLLKVKNPLLK